MIRGLRAATFGALADVIESEVDAQDEENAGLRARLEDITDAVVVDGSTPESARVRKACNSALDLLILLDEKDLEGEIPHA